jgi:arsenite-transporting ATPase
MRRELDDLVAQATRSWFFAGKGGVGKTSLACAFAVALADSGKRTLLVSTDPASNLDEVLGVTLASVPTDVPGVARLRALNIDPVAAARAYRETMVAPLRRVLPADAVASVEEQLSGACAVEIAAFDEFSRWLADPSWTAAFDHVVFDTAPTGHTLRLLELPAAWGTFLDTATNGSSCLGPLAGLSAQRALYAAARDALADPRATGLVLVARPEGAALAEAARTRHELAQLGIGNVLLFVNGVFRAADRRDAVAVALEDRGRKALDAMPRALRSTPRVAFPLRSSPILGIASLRDVFLGVDATRATPADGPPAPVRRDMTFDGLIDAIGASGSGVVMTMGKGGVGKTSVARSIALGLARKGHRVRWTTTDPAGRVDDAAEVEAAGIRLTRIDPKVEVAAYTQEVLDVAGDLALDARALLEEDLRSPCTEEVAVFRALSRVVAEGTSGFTLIDTAPTGHTVLLLVAAGHYHREVSRTAGAVPDAVRSLLPRLRDPVFTMVVIVTLPEATPVHEAAALQADLRRAGVEPYAWVVNQSLAPLSVTDPVLVSRRRGETRYLSEVRGLSPRVVVVPWQAAAAGTSVAEARGRLEQEVASS